MKQKPVIIKNNTADGSKCKQYFIEFITKDLSPSIRIKKLMLCHESEFEYLIDMGFIPVKKFKDYYLFQQMFSIKISTLNCAIDQLNKLIY